MSEEKSVIVSSVFDMISKIQRVLFNITLFVIPWLIIPLPFDSTERIKSILFIALSSLLVLLEVVKWIWDGKVSIVKSKLDKIFLLLFFSFLVTTLFARDSWISMWGYDGRMGTGFFVMVFLFLFFFLSRGFMQKKKEIVNAITALSLGLFALITLSMLSVLKVDILGWFPYVRDFFTVGLPLTFSFQEIMLLSGVSIFLNIFLLIEALQSDEYQSSIFPVVSTVISFISLAIFSVNQGALIPILFFVVAIFVCVLLWLKLDKKLKALPVVIALFTTLTLVFCIGFQYEPFRKALLGSEFTTMTPIRLGSDISWGVSSSSIVGDFFRGLVGLGNDSFGIGYNIFKPSTDATIALGNTTFVTASNEIFTTLSNRGLIGVTVWLLLGLSYLRLLVKNISSSKKEGAFSSILLGLVALFVYLGSIFLPYSFLMYFVLFVLTILLVAIDSKENDNDEFLLKFWAVNTGTGSRDINKTMEGVNWFITILFTVLTLGVIIFLSVRTLGTAYVVRAESYNIEMNTKYQNEPEVTQEVREEYLERIAGYYDNALRYDASNPYINRKSSLIALEIINLLSERYADAEENEKEGILSTITTWKNTAIDLSKEAINTSPLTYANWNTRAAVYIGLISVGFSDYSQDALNALQTCVNINPLDYDSYYKAAQIYMVKEDYDKALSTLDTVLRINGQHVPSLILSASILYEQKNTEQAILYLQAAKEILEVNKLDSGETYDNIVKSLEQLGATEEDLEKVEEIEDQAEKIETTEEIVEETPETE
ncbi:MAG TPA: tetratricopeptide repeat protein [Candidatus Dojkabacteria bacterium]|nr:tetratricopeptide repeat protein [Candidatus Dojkabacteria bacterium]